MFSMQVGVEGKSEDVGAATTIPERKATVDRPHFFFFSFRSEGGELSSSNEITHHTNRSHHCASTHEHTNTRIAAQTETHLCCKRPEERS